MEVTPDNTSDTKASSGICRNEPSEKVPPKTLAVEFHGEHEDEDEEGGCSRRKRKKPNRYSDMYEDNGEKEVDNGMSEPQNVTSIPIGFQIRKKFKDGKYYEGGVVSGPEPVEKVGLCWRIRYTDGDEEDFSRKELLTWGVDTAPLLENSRPDNTHDKKRAALSSSKNKGTKTKTHYKSHLTDYEAAKSDLCCRMGVTEEEVVAVLNQMSPPYGLNAAMQLIHEAKDNPDPNHTERKKFEPKVGLRVRKNYMGCTYYGKVTQDADWLEVDGLRVKMWEVTFDDGDKEDMDFNELRMCDANRPTRTHPIRGRQLCSLELFSGCGVVTQEFAHRRWKVRSIDNSPTSYATDKLDIMKVQFKDIGMVPDFIWASPPCFTYSNMAGGVHRSPHKGEFEKTQEAMENNRLLAQLAYYIRWAKSKNPHLIVVIENPVGLLQKMPLMKEMIDSLGLFSTIVHYCAFGRDDKKPTFLWTNDFKLCSTLSEFKCSQNKCPYCGAQTHAISARRHSQYYNPASIPQALAEEVADHVHSTFYERRIRYTEQAKVSKEEEEEFNRVMSSG